MMLSDAQKRLDEHFLTLKSERSERGYPVYAFEHGLQTVDIAAIKGELQRQLQTTRRLQQEYWLLWTVVAAEIGYTYDGDEYWQSFSREVPSWPLLGDRDVMRDWFRAFAARFSGFAPSGRWADHFSIIAWPITHSILPVYLQSHFAAHLHDIRYELAQEGYLGIALLGEFIRCRYYGGSSRFSNFLQQVELTAHLVFALRDEDMPGEVSPIHRPTLARIVSDLESRQSGRMQLRETRTILREARLQATHGLVGGRRSAQTPGTHSATAALRFGAPKVAARHTARGPWQLGVVLPDFVAILRSTPYGPSDLDKVRIRFADVDGWEPGRALTSYSQKHRPLGTFPALDAAFLRFDTEVAGLTEVFEQHFRLQGTFPLLLRVHEDGIARQVHGNHVRTNQTYLIVAGESLPFDIVQKLALVQVECLTTGVTTYSLQSPVTFGDQHFQALKALKFGYGLRARVEPVGLVARGNNAGGSTWLPDEEIILRLSADFDVTGFEIALEGEPRTHVPVARNNEVLISLGALPIGPHVVEISAVGAIKQRVEPESLLIEVRPHEAWQDCVRRQAGFRLLLEPLNASFEDIMKGEAKVTIYGPAGRSANVAVHLFDANGHFHEEHILARLQLPVDAGACRRALEKLAEEPLISKLESAQRFDIAVSVEELGFDSLIFHQDVRPLRWKIEHRNKEFVARLVDEAGADQEIVVQQYGISRPDRRVAADTKKCLSGIEVTPPGSLFVARYHQSRYAAIISLREKLTTFADLGVRVYLEARALSASRRVAWFLAQHHRWYSAMPLGPMSIVYKSKVVATIEHQIARTLCHAQWADRLEDCRSGRNQFLDDLQRDVGGSPGFRISVWDEALASNSVQDVERIFLEKATKYRVENDLALCALALRMAFRPAKVRFDGWVAGQAQLRRLLAKSTLVRGAYLAKLAYDTHALDRRSSKEVNR